MPELPEVETIRRDLESKIIGMKFTGVKIFLPKMLKETEINDLERAVTDARIDSVARRGKIILLELSSGFTVLIHLKMSGQLLYLDDEDPVGKWTHVIFGLSNGYALHMRDQRQFGYVRVVKTETLGKDPVLSKLGPEPFGSDFTTDYLRGLFKIRKKAKIKAVLLDQNAVAGIGNIYADEILHEARISPVRAAHRLTKRETETVRAATIKILTSAIDNRGSSFSKYVDLSGEQGGYVRHHRVYRREGQRCLRDDGGIIERIKISGRSTFFCPKCQR